MMMDEDINEFLVNYNLKYDLSSSYINILFLDIKHYLKFLNYKKFKLTKKNILKYVYDYFNQNLHINYDVLELSKIKQPIQRSPEWYNTRYNMISASDASAIFGKKFDYICDSEKKNILFKNGFKTKKDLIKVKVLQKDEFVGNKYTEHGIIFEEVANLIYQKRNNTNVIEFGLVKHPKIPFLGASPDGITKDSIMLEIKCPYKRKLNGLIPSNYWIQMQLQLECCNLNICDFVEIKVDFYQTKEDYYNDTDQHNLSLTLDKLEKGIIIKYLDNNYTYQYLYPSLDIFIDYNLLEEWTNKMYNFYSKHYSDVSIKYWKITEYSNIRVFRDKNWFNKSYPILKEFWNTIVLYKNDIDLFNKDILDTKKKYVKNNSSNNQQLLMSDSDDDNKNTIHNNQQLLMSDSDDDNKNTIHNSQQLLMSDNDDDNNQQLLMSDSDNDNSQQLLMSNNDDDNISNLLENNIVIETDIIINDL